MSNLENLTRKIIEDAKIEADEILKDANKKKEEIIDEQVKKAQVEKDKIIEKARKDAESIKNRILSNAELVVRNETLKAKQEVIDRVFQLAREKLVDLNEKEYVEFLKNNIDSANLTGKEILVVPENRRELVKSLGLNIQVSDVEAVPSGFVIINQHVKMNFSFEALIDFLREDLELEIAQELFQEE